MPVMTVAVLRCWACGGKEVQCKTMFLYSTSLSRYAFN